MLDVVGVNRCCSNRSKRIFVLAFRNCDKNYRTYKYCSLNMSDILFIEKLYKTKLLF